MKMKRLISIVLALMLMLGVLSGCGAKEEVPPVNNGGGVVETPETNGEEEQEEEVVLNPEEVVLNAVVDYMNNIPDNNNMIQAAEGLQIAEENAGQVMILDIRRVEDYEAGHFPTAVNIPLAELGKNLDRLPTNKQIIINCYSGQTSGIAMTALRVLGFNALSYAGGFNNGFGKLDVADGYELDMETNPLPDPKAPTLDEEGQILWDTVAAFFNEGKTYIESPANVNDLIEANPGAVFVMDIRAGEDYEKGHIEDAVNIPFKTVGNNLDQVPKNRPVYIVCYSGQTAAQILTSLRLAGYNAFSISGGMGGWNGAELPVVTN